MQKRNKREMERERGRWWGTRGGWRPDGEREREMVPDKVGRRNRLSRRGDVAIGSRARNWILTFLLAFGRRWRGIFMRSMQDRVLKLPRMA